MKTISAEQLKSKLSEQTPNNSHPRTGFTLINVLSAENFREKHIPGSISIPLSQVENIPRRFEKEKEIFVYCSSLTSDASRKAAATLESLGFRNVHAFEGGMEDWDEFGFETEAGVNQSGEPAESSI